jgi:hypothetical protein
MESSRKSSRLSGPTVGALRTFAYWIANGTAGYQLLDGIDYWQVMREEPSLSTKWWVS